MYDRISRQNLTEATIQGDRFAVGEALYGALLIRELEVAEPEMVESVGRIADAGIPVVVAGGLPERAPGFTNYQERDADTRRIADRLQSKVVFVEDESGVGIGFKELGLQPPLATSDGSEPAFAPEHREVANGHILMLFNESNEARTQKLIVILPAGSVRILDPETGSVITEASPDRSGQLSVAVTIPARRAVILMVEE